MNFRMLMEKKQFLSYVFFLFSFFCTGMKENQELKEANKRLDWLVSFIDMYFPCNALVVLVVCMRMH